MGLLYSTFFPAPPEEVFWLTYDFEAQVRISDRLVSYRKLEPGPIEIGDRLEVVIKEGWWKSKVVTTVREFQGEGPVWSDLIESRPLPGIRVLVHSRAESCSGGAKFTVEVRPEPTSFLGWPMWLLYRLGAAAAYDRYMRNWFEELASELERRRLDSTGA